MERVIERAVRLRVAGVLRRGACDWRAERGYAVALARAFASAILFAMPLHMTMELWQLGVTIEPHKLLILLAILLPLIAALSNYWGFEDAVNWLDLVLDALAALLVAVAAAALVLGAFAIIGPDAGMAGLPGRLLLAAVPGSIGAALAQSQLGQDEEGGPTRRNGTGSFSGEFFVMGVGALFLALPLAPTEEIRLIAYRMSSPLALGLMLGTLALMHAFVYALHFRGEERPRGTSAVAEFAKLTLPGYAIALLLALYALWTFDQLAGHGATQIAIMAVVLGLPGALGAAAARLIL